MKVIHYTEIPSQEIMANVQMRILISTEDNAPNFIMRLFHVEPGGHTPYHSHDWEHEVFITDGKGVLITNQKEIPFKTSSSGTDCFNFYLLSSFHFCYFFGSTGR